MRSLSLLTLLMLSPAWCQDSAPEPSPSFRRDIAPILRDRCVACHAAKKAEGGYRLDTFAEMLKPGDSGALPVAMEKGQPSELLRRLSTDDESERMPAESKPLSDDQIQLIKAWIDSGGNFDGEKAGDLLSFVIPPPQHPEPPETYATAVPIIALAFSPDGSQLLAGGYHEITVWNAGDGQLQRRIGNVGQRIFAIAFDPDNANSLAVACGAPGRSGELRLLDFKSGQVKAVAARSTDVILDVAYRPGKRQLAVAGADHTIRILDADTLDVVRTLASHADSVTDVTWSQDGSRLVSASRDKSAKVFDGENGQLLISYQGHGQPVRGVAVMADGKQVISSGTDQHLHRWNIADAKRVAHLNLGGEAYRPALGETWALIPCADHRLLRIDLGNNSLAGEMKGHSDWVLSVAVTPDHSRAASGSLDGEIRVWNTADAALLKSWTAKP